MERQETLGQVTQDLEGRLGGVWAGSYIDQADRGQLVVLSTDVAAARTLVSGLPQDLREYVEVREAKRSAAELSAEQSRITAILRRERIAPMQIGPDAARNALVVGPYRPVPGPTALEGGTPEAILERVTAVLTEASSFALVQMLDHGPPRFGPATIRNPGGVPDCE